MTPEEFRAMRHALGLTQTEFGNELGLGMRAIRRYELGERKIPGPVILLARRIAAERAALSDRT